MMYVMTQEGLIVLLHRSSLSLKERVILQSGCLQPVLGAPPPQLLSHDQMEDVLNQCCGADPSTFSKTNHVAPIRRTISSDVRRGHQRFLQRLHTSSYRELQPFFPLLLPRGGGVSAGQAAL